MNTKEERKKLLERFMEAEITKKISLRDRIKRKKPKDHKFSDIFTLAGCIYRTMAWGNDILRIEKYDDSDEDYIILPHFLDAIINGKEMIAPLFNVSDLTMGSLMSKAQPIEGEEEMK